MADRSTNFIHNVAKFKEPNHVWGGFRKVLCMTVLVGLLLSWVWDSDYLLLADAAQDEPKRRRRDRSRNRGEANCKATQQDTAI
eukprot:579754-Amphidinium_carterae.2